MSDFWVDGVFDDIVSLNMSSFTSSLTWYPFTITDNGRGGQTEGFGAPISNIPCRMDSEVSNRYPERAKDDIDVLRVQRTIYIPKDLYNVGIQDKVSTNAGSPSGSNIDYRVLDVNIETDELDIALLVEVIQ